MSARLTLACLLCLGVGLAVGALVLGSSSEDSNGEELWVPAEVDQIGFAVSHIVVPTNDDRSPAEAEVLINQAYRLLVQGQDFATVARGRSEDRAAQDGGYLGFVDVSKDTAFTGVIRALKPGQVSPPVKTAIGWQIVKRHSFEAGRALEHRSWIPAHGIFIRWDGLEDGIAGLTREAAREKAAALVVQLKKGETTLNEAMQQFVNPRFHKPDAYIAMVSDRELTAMLYEALKDLKPGEFTGPVDTSSGWGVLKRGRHLRAVFRHILFQHALSEQRALSASRTPQDALDTAQRVLDEARADPSRWDALVRQYSDDPRSVGNRGSMGLLHPGSLPMGFEKVVYDTKPGEIYPQVVESVYGYHILWRVN